MRELGELIATPITELASKYEISVHHADIYHRDAVKELATRMNLFSTQYLMAQGSGVHVGDHNKNGGGEAFDPLPTETRKIMADYGCPWFGSVDQSSHPSA